MTRIISAHQRKALDDLSSPTTPRTCPTTAVTTATMGKPFQPPSPRSTKHPHSYDDYEPAEATFDEEPVFEPQDPDDVENPDGTDNRDRALHIESGHGEGEANGHTIVPVGDGAEAGGHKATGGGKKNAVQGLRDKKIPKEKRSTTPYMTKYERARVLGTRALQIR